ncbi:patatin-like phospholipase family protein [Pseudoalteromonas sp. C2R02]|uniref:patatin-like phospholipase family protein n=1 Tax=Pseudoalteromonas sp. C2R02 TaxID=2841565 RepID=UPI001C09C2AA|nr:patatin-like phospholipase family protein [Pseudoalteromonas sp. C2R02]MBU2972069.1 patatin-like phospholipase family protein [Pseudoalteromonas sp. C2R02]
MNIPRLTNVLFVVFTFLFCVSCAQKIAHNPLSKSEYNAIDFADSKRAERWWGDVKPPLLKENLHHQAIILQQRFPSAIKTKSEASPDFDALTLSGGGADGAFGAGILVGWTQSGSRPEFELVVGTSTGAVIAPFAFLGAEYDDILFEIYSQLTQEKVYRSQLLSGILGGSSIADTKYLQLQIKKYITLDLIKKIAIEHKKARSLLVVTTHFDAMRPMIWDIGTIAMRENNAAVEQIREIILASASIPIYFPPVAIELHDKTKPYTELHVDGGLTRNAFSYPAQISIDEIERIQGLYFNRNIYVIQNGNSSMQYEPAETDLSSIAARTMLGLLQDKINSDIERIYYLSQRDKLNFNMIEIPDDFIADKAIEFDSTYINKLLKLGIKLGKSGDFWRKKPPSER